jgi:hypothetical protein
MEVRKMKNFFKFLKKMYLFPLNALLGVTTTATTATAGVPYVGMGKVFITQPYTVTIPSTGVTNDIVQTIPIKAGWLVLGTIIKPVTAGVGGTITLDVGITGGTADGFDAAINGETAVGTNLQSTPSDTYPAAGGFLAAADDTIDILLKSIVSAITTEPVFTIQAICINTN